MIDSLIKLFCLTINVILNKITRVISFHPFLNSFPACRITSKFFWEVYTIRFPSLPCHDFATRSSRVFPVCYTYTSAAVASSSSMALMYKKSNTTTGTEQKRQRASPVHLPGPRGCAKMLLTKQSGVGVCEESMWGLGLKEPWVCSGLVKHFPVNEDVCQ